MTFLNPAILFGLLAATLPIIFHFLNLRKVKRVEFPSLKFLKELQQTKIKRLKFRQLLLLLLRVLIIVSIVLAFARPTVQSNLPIYSGTKRAQFFILDNSFSMSRLDEGGSYFNLAKSVINRMVENTNEVSGNYLITTTSDSLITLPANAESAKRIIDGIELNHKRGNISSAINRAILLSKEKAGAVNEFYLLSDIQKSNIAVDSMKNTIPVGITNSFYIYNFENSGINNRSISGLKVDSQILRQGQNVSVSALVTNHSGTTVSNQAASLYVNDKRKSLQSFSLQPNESTTLIFSFTLEEDNFLTVTVELEEDDILIDNSAYLSLFISGITYATIYSGIPDNYKFVKSALDESSNIVVNVLTPLNPGSTASDKTVSIIFLENAGIAEQAARLVSSGHSAIVFPGRSLSTNAFKLYCESLGVDAGTLRANSLAEFKEVEFQHPVLQSLFEKEKFELSSPSIFTHYSRRAGTSEKPITILTDGSVFLSELIIDNQKSLLFNSAPTLDWGNFPLKSIFAPLLARSVFYLNSSNNEQQPLTVGDDLVIETKEILKELKIITPDKLEDSITPDALINKNNFTYKEIYKSGYYRIYKNGTLASIRAVNTDPMESDPNYFAAKDTEELFNGLNIKSFPFTNQQELDQLKQDNLLGTELMKHFLILALIFALLEMVVSRNSKKDLTELRVK